MADTRELPLEIQVAVDIGDRAVFRIDPGIPPICLASTDFSWSIPPAEAAILTWTD